MPNIRFDRFYRYPELSGLLQEFATEFRELVRVQSIGKSYEGRDIPVVTVTNQRTGDALDKPAFWTDGNIHATEVAGSSACLYLLNQLVTQYGRDADITRLLDTRTVYICPRINPDGAEWALADRPKIIRSSTRPYPFADDDVEGLEMEDVDGDGRILFMRIRDSNGPWKCHPDDPRLMIKRGPTEGEGQFYRVLPEGRIKDYDGVTITVQKPKQGLDLNRNFPANWRQEYEQLGAGPYPTSEPEVRAIVQFFTDHPNICSGVAFHTWSGVLLRPFDHLPDTDMPPEDLWIYQHVGAKGTEITGYPNISVYHEFRYHPKQVIGGAFDWIYDHLGMFSWVVEIWSPQRQAGIEKYAYIDWFRDHPPEDDLKILRWSDEKLNGAAFVEWYPFAHPELGDIELGGWNRLHAISNPPLFLLEKEISLFPRWLIYQALLSPKLELHSASVERADDNTYRIRCVVHNTGWLPTYVTKRALERQVVRGVIGTIELPPDAKLVSGKIREDYGQLEGRAHKHTSLSFWPDYTPTSDRVKMEWVVRGNPGDKVQLSARHERAGVIQTTLTL